MNNKTLLYVSLIIGYIYILSIFAKYMYTGIFGFEITCLLAGLLFFFVFYAIGIKSSVDNLVQPLHIVFFFYLCIFFIAPLWLVTSGKADNHGYNVMGGCVYGTFLAVLAFASFLVGYNYKKKHRDYVYTPFQDTLSQATRIKVLKYSYIALGLLIAVNLLQLILIGYNLTFLLTMGGEGLANVVGIPDNLRFLFNLAYLTLVPWLFVMAYSKKKWTLILSTYLLIVIFFAYGWRFIIYIVAIAGAVVYYKTRNKKPKILHILVLGLILFAYSVVGGMLRGAMRSGESAQLNRVEKNDMLYTIESNFDIYKTYYGAVDTYPEKHDFYYGKAIVWSSIAMWIPRFIWPDKPWSTEWPTIEAFNIGSGGDSVIKYAMSSPNLTEYYIDFGIFGIIGFSFLLGYISSRMLKYYYKNSLYDVIKYAIFCGYLIQIINRGYMAQQFTLAFFLFGPLLFYRKYFRDK